MEVAIEGLQGADVVLQLVARLADVVEDARVGGDLEGPAKLDEGGAKVLLVEELETSLKMLAGLFGGRLGVGRVREREGEGEQQGESAHHWA